MLIKSIISRLISHPQKNPVQFRSIRTFVDNVDIKFVRDKDLDRVVSREKDLKTLINLKNFIKLNSNSLPLSSIIKNNKTLKIPIQPIEFIRNYPNFFEEFNPGNNNGVGIDPHFRLTEKSLNLDAEEQLIFDSDKKNAADRLLKLLMLCKVSKIPINLIDKLKFDLGLADNYVDSLIPEFPDYFRVERRKGSELFLELVHWNDELAVSCFEKMSKKSSNFDVFPMKYSKGFDMDDRFKKWVVEWQKLPYISPYENVGDLHPNSDESDKWAVGVLHELLSILIGKKSERENVVLFGGCLGVKPRIKRAMAHHPGIFYVSRKNETYTVVLKEAYERNILIDKHELVEVRRKYHQLMVPVKEVEKSENEDGVVGVDVDVEDDKEDGDEGKAPKAGGMEMGEVNEDGRERGGKKSDGKGFGKVNVERDRRERRGTSKLSEGSAKSGGNGGRNERGRANDVARNRRATSVSR